MSFRLSRAIASWGHILVSVFQLAFIYTSLHDVPGMFQVVQWGSTPLLFITGFWLYFGKKIYRDRVLLRKEASRQEYPPA